MNPIRMVRLYQKIMEEYIACHKLIVRKIVENAQNDKDTVESEYILNIFKTSLENINRIQNDTK